MKQTESRTIRQLWKDGPVMFLLSLLVLLMGIQVTFACECQEADFLRAMCPAENKAVIVGRLLNESSIGSTSQSGMSLLHNVQLYKIYKEGSTNLTVSQAGPRMRIIKMISPEGCSLVNSGSNDASGVDRYIIYGETDAEGVLHSSKCTAARRVGFFTARGRENYLSIMSGDQDNPTC